MSGCEVILLSYKKIYLVNENDEVIKAGTWDEAYSKTKNYFTRVVHIWLFNKKGEILVQKRANDLRLYPNYYDSSAAGHVDFGETYEKSASRELREELGLNIKLTPLIKIKIKTPTIREWVFLFVGLYKNEKIVLEHKEVSNIKFYSLKHIKKTLNNGKFTPVFKRLFKTCFYN